MIKFAKNKLRVVHFPQIGSSPESFKFEVKNEEFAYAIIKALALQHLWLEKNHFIPDYSNAIFVEMFEDDEWVNYFNHEEEMEWNEVEDYFDQHN